MPWDPGTRATVLPLRPYRRRDLESGDRARERSETRCKNQERSPHVENGRRISIQADIGGLSMMKVSLKLLHVELLRLVRQKFV